MTELLDDPPQWQINLAVNTMSPMINLGVFRGFEKRRGIVVAAGPSLSKCADELSRVDQGRFFIVSITTILPAFKAIGIQPDYVVCGGEGDESYFLKHMDGKFSQLILSTTSHPNSARHHISPWWYNNRNHRIRDRGLEVKYPDIHGIDSHAGTMAMHAIKVALLLQKTSPVAVVGLDLEVQDPKNHHAFNVCPIEDFPDVYHSEDAGVSIMRNSYAKSLKFVEEWAEKNPGLVVNCTDGGAVKGFPRMALRDFTAEYGKFQIQ